LNFKESKLKYVQYFTNYAEIGTRIKVR